MEKILMTSIEAAILEKVKTLPLDKQQQVLYFVEFMQSKSQRVEFKHSERTPMSALEAAGDLVGCVDGGPGDLATNKKYLLGMLVE